jgi:methylenetetrahydrofolate--tRNA-(uracil-5-)-methyltransferase
MEPLGIKKRMKKREKNALLAQRALEEMDAMKDQVQ